MYQKRLKKHYGQHFLVDEWLLAELVGHIAPQPSDCVVEIGPGSGQLTKPISQKVHKMCLIEVDHDCVAYLQSLSWPCAVTVMPTDVLRVDWGFLQEFSAPSMVRILGNLPYNISSQILIASIAFRHRFLDATFLIQKEVAQRCLASPGSKAYSRSSVMIQTYFEVSAVMDVPPEAFQPPPKVDSMVIRLQPVLHTESLPEAYEWMVALAFSSRRKTLRRALASKVDDDFWQSLPESMATARAETLSIADFKILASNYERRKLEK